MALTVICPSSTNFAGRGTKEVLAVAIGIDVKVLSGIKLHLAHRVHIHFIIIDRGQIGIVIA
jgi:hypothetical protein